jgi:hypothetical protein
MNKKAKTRDNINYFGLAAIACLLIFVVQYGRTRDVCPRSGGIFYIAGSISLIIFLAGKNISRMAQKGAAGWKVAFENIVLSILLLALSFVTSVYLFFCLV